MNNRPSQNDQDESKNHAHYGGFAFHKKGGIYLPITDNGQEEYNKYPRVINVVSRIPVEIKRDTINVLFATLATIISAITLCVVVQYTSYSRGQWIEAQHSVDQLRRQTAMDNRAWLVLDTEYSDDKAQIKQARELTIPIKLVNTGHSPAKNIHGSVKVKFLSRNELSSFTYDMEPPRNTI